MRGSYGEWSAWLSDFALGKQDEQLSLLSPMSVEALGSVAAVRLAQRCAEALSRRLLLWGENFNRELQRVSQPDELRMALRSARSGLTPLRALACSPLLLAELRASLDRQLQEALERIQRDLEREVQKVDGFRDTLLRIVREQPLDRAVVVSLAAQADEGCGYPAAFVARRVLLG